jgi:hypothetical protein
LRSELYRVFGVDLTNVPGISAVTAQTILCEVGPDLSRFRNASACASWLGLCPEKQISGGKLLYTRTRQVRNRVSIALRLGAYVLHHADNYLGEFFRRRKRKLEKPKAVTATAHKLARIVFHLLTTKQEYNESVFLQHEKEAAARDSESGPKGLDSRSPGSECMSCSGARNWPARQDSGEPVEVYIIVPSIGRSPQRSFCSGDA